MTMQLSCAQPWHCKLARVALATLISQARDASLTCALEARMLRHHAWTRPLALAHRRAHPLTHLPLPMQQRGWRRQPNRSPPGVSQMVSFPGVTQGYGLPGLSLDFADKA